MGSDPQSHLIQQHEAGLADARRAFEYLFGSQMVGKPLDLQSSMAEKILAAMKTERETLEGERGPGLKTPALGPENISRAPPCPPILRF